MSRWLGSLSLIAALVGMGMTAGAQAIQERVAPRGEETTLGQQSEADGTAAGQEPEARPDLVLPQVRETLTDEEERALRLVRQILEEQDMLASGTEFIYRSGGRRDPFRNLLRARQREIAAPEQRPPGLAGFLISEVTVKAVAQFQGRWHAMLVGPDRRSYFARVGTELYDGRVVEIAQDRIVFEQEVEDLLGARSTRSVVKRLSTESQG